MGKGGMEMSKVNENISKFRRFRGIKQSEMAKALGKSRNSVSNWEANGNAPDLDTIEKICKILGVTPNQLFGWEPWPEYEKHIEQVRALNRRREELLKELETVNARIDEIRGEQ